ncbi:polysaccharide deacetylase family protein [Candidatus Woesebacteria bacterium]|nr:polysaccharide deacetylase family protein [Candidatus Woesebacteria bacterium]
MNRKKKIIISFALIVLLLFTGYGLLQISKSRTFQFFGEIVPRVETNEKVVALTFDDGPTVYTKDVLNTLEEKNIKATFFVMGSELEKKPEIGKTIASEGHELANHSYSHQRMWFKSQSFIADEIEKTNTLIRETGYKGDIHFRPPYGKKILGLPWYLSKHDIKTIMVDVEPDTYGSEANFLVEYTLENTKSGSIILLHPFCETCSGQREAIGRIVDGLQAKGFRFVTVSELLTYKNK